MKKSSGLMMDQLNLLMEDQLLMYCTRIDVNEDTKRQIKKILNNNLNWDYILEIEYSS